MSDTDSSASTMIVALVAIVVIVAVGFLFYKNMIATPVTPAPGVQINVPVGSADGR